MFLHGKKALVTGGGSGIGLALARALSGAGARVTICGRSAAKLEAARAAHPDLTTIVADLSDPRATDALGARLAVEEAPLDILVHNAGVMRVVDLREPGDIAEDEREIATNLLAPMRLTRALLPSLLRRPEAAIVTVTSGAALVPMTWTPIYSASKAALRSYTRALRRQLRGSAVHVMEVIPPLVETDMPQKLSGSAGRMKKMTPEACAARVVRGLERGERELCLGPNGLLRWADVIAPGFAESKMAEL
jgi:uncharacterized oxidoreductase